MSSSRIVEIIIRANDQASPAAAAIASKFLAVERKIQNAANRLKSLASAKYSATISLIDRVTPEGSRIGAVLKSLAGKAYRITCAVTDNASGKLQSLNALCARLAAKTVTITANVKDGFSKKLSGLGEGIAQGAGVFAPLAGVAGIGFGIANAAQASMSFERQMSKVQAISGLSKDSEEFQSLVEQAKFMGATTAWTREEAGFAQEKMAMAGWSVPQMNAALKPLMNLASAGATDLETTSDILTDAMTGLQLKANETFKLANGQQVNAAEHFADMFAATITSSNTDIKQMGDALKYSGAAVGAMFSDKDIQTRMEAAQDLMVMTGLQANAGIKSSQAGTTSRAIFSRFGAENRNAKFALETLGVDFTDTQTGEVRRIRDIFKDLRTKFNEGGNVEEFAKVAEALSGEKINADTRRKLDSFLKSVQERGGKMTGADKLKMASMLAGQEAMSGFLAAMLGDWDALEEKIENCHGAAERMAKVQLDNLAGDITMLGSAWDAFQQDLFNGVAGDGLRSFVQTLTDVVTKANNLFKDGIQVGDFGKILFDVVDRLRAKFMQLDGIGSILAGGVLMGALAKIGSKIRSLSNSFRELRTGISGTNASTSTSNSAKGGISASQSVGSMTVTANVVNVNGRAGSAGSAGGRKVGNQSIIDNYNRTKAQIRDGQPPPPTSSRFAGARSAGIAGAAMAGVFGVMDVMATKEHGKARLEEANQAVAYHRQELQNLRDSGASQAQIDAQIQEVNDAQAFVQRTEKLNREEEFRAGAGATGAVIGTALGAALGSIGGPVGMMIGGTVGGMIGDALAQKAADWKLKRDEETPKSAETERHDFFSDEKPKSSETVQAPASMGGLRQQEQAEAPPQVSMADRYREKVTARHEAEQREAATQAQVERFQKIDSKLGVSSPFKNSATLNATQDFYQQQQQFMKANPDAQAPADTPAQRFGKWLDDLFSDKPQPQSEAAQDALKSLEGDSASLERLSEAGLAGEMPSTLANLEGTDLSALSEAGVSGSTESPFANLFDFELPEIDLSGIFDSITTQISEMAASLPELFSGAFDGLGDMISSGLEAASSAASGALDTITTTFTSAKDGITSAWADVPSFFSGLFDGLGGVASAAGSAILSGLTSVCGAVISAWQGVASAVMGVISSISNAVANIKLPSFGGGVGKAEGGFVSAETHFYAGEHGPEVVIPLSSGQRARALDLFEKTGAILGGESMSFGGDEIKDPEIKSFENVEGVDIPEFNRITGDETIDVQRSKRRAQEALLAETQVTTPSTSASPNEIQLGGINITFNVTGDNPDEILSTIREHLAEVTDQIAGKLSEQIQSVHANQPLEN